MHLVQEMMPGQVIYNCNRYISLTHHQWIADFKKRELMLDWDNIDVGDYGATCIQSAQFIEASERFKDMKFVSGSTPNGNCC